MEIRDFIERYKILLIILAIVGIVFILPSNEKYPLFQNTITTNIELPCYSFEECKTFLKNAGYTDKQIEESVFCENNKCYMKGYIEYGKK